MLINNQRMNKCQKHDMNEDKDVEIVKTSLNVRCAFTIHHLVTLAIINQ